MAMVTRVLGRMAEVLIAAGLPFLGAWGSWELAGFLIPAPSGPHCGLAVLPSLFFGGFAAFIAFLSLGMLSAFWFENWIESFGDPPEI